MASRLAVAPDPRAVVTVGRATVTPGPLAVVTAARAAEEQPDPAPSTTPVQPAAGEPSPAGEVAGAAAQPTPSGPAPAPGGPAPAPGTAPAPGAAPPPEELLKVLFDPLVQRLKAELWLDRERRGALTDLLH